MWHIWSRRVWLEIKKEYQTWGDGSYEVTNKPPNAGGGAKLSNKRTQTQARVFFGFITSAIKVSTEVQWKKIRIKTKNCSREASPTDGSPDDRGDALQERSRIHWEYNHRQHRVRIVNAKSALEHAPRTSPPVAGGTLCRGVGSWHRRCWYHFLHRRHLLRSSGMQPPCLHNKAKKIFREEDC